MIVVEEELVLSPDFLYTLALLSDTFRKDETIGAIQLWNPNCKILCALCFLYYKNMFSFNLAYEIINGSIELIYHVDQFFGLAYLLKRSFYDKHMKDSFKQCCSKRYMKFFF